MPEWQKLNRADREAQLLRMTITASGREEITALYKQHAKIPEDAPPPAGVPLGEMVETILSEEYPPGN